VTARLVLVASPLQVERRVHSNCEPLPNYGNCPPMVA
jgi:hypothetical protein